MSVPQIWQDHWSQSLFRVLFIYLQVKARLGKEGRVRGKVEQGKVWEVAIFPPKPGSHVLLPPV